MQTFPITGEYIELIKLLKAMSLAENGAHAQEIVMEQRVKVNGIVETRKRAKVRPGDVVEVDKETIKIE